MKRCLFRVLEAVFLWLDEFVAAGLNWIDRHYPDPDIDDDDPHAVLLGREDEHQPSQLRITVHLPRSRQQRMH